MISKLYQGSDALASSEATKVPNRKPTWIRLLSIYADARLLLWNGFLVLAFPLLLAMKVRRRMRKRNGQEFDFRRWFVPCDPVQAGHGTHLVLFGASFGEMLMMDRLTKALRQRDPQVRVTWAMRDPQTFEHLRATRHDIRVVPWPFDSLLPVAAWVRKNQPDAVVFIERYNFPCLVVACRNWGARVLLASGRAKGLYQRQAGLVRAYYRWVFEGFDALLLQSVGEADRVAGVAPRVRCHVTGNIKFDLAPASAKADGALAEWLEADSRALLIAGSTDDAIEESFVFAAYEIVRAGTPARLLVAPRNVNRAGEVEQEAQARGFTTCRRAERASGADVLILDTMGELAAAYGHGVAAFIGGTVTGKGHNVLEPLEHGVPVSYGPAKGHFEDLQRLCERFGVGFRMANSTQLAHHWIAMLRDDSLKSSVATRAGELLASERGSLDATVEAISVLCAESNRSELAGA